MLRWLFGVAAAGLLAVSGARAASGDEPIILEARVNGERRGDVLVVPASDGQAPWIRRSDFAKLRIDAPGLPVRQVGSEEFIGLHGERRLRAVLDLEKLELDVQAAPELLGLQVVNLSRTEKPALAPVAPAHAFLNYSLARQQQSEGPAVTALDGNATVAWGGWSLRSEHSYATNRSPSHLRLRTYALHDRPEDMVRITVGDVQAGAGAFTRAGPMGGINVSRLFELQPGFVRSPVVGHAGSVTTASTAEIFVDGVRLRTLRLQPGLYELRDLNYFGGMREVQIVITDAFGGRQVISRPFYFAEQNLRAGLSEFSYSVGRLRRAPANGDGYGDPGFSGFHRYGLTDALTLGLAAERYPGYAALGASASLRHERLGTLSLNASRSATSRPEHGSGHALAATYGYAGRGWSVAASALQQGRDFGRFPAAGANVVSLAPAALRDAISLGGAIGIGAGKTLGADYVRTRSYGPAATSLAVLRYGASVASGVTLNASLGRRDDGLRQGVEAMLSLSINLDRDWNVSARHERGLGGRSLESLRLARAIPAADGFGGRAGVERSGDGVVSDVFVQANSAWGAAGVSARRQEASTGAVSSGAELRFAGAVALFDGSLFAARRIDQSFAMVDASGLAGVRVYQNNQLIGRTRGDGRLLAPSLGAYSVNQIRLDDRDIPMEVSLTDIVRAAVPRALSGTAVRFAASRISAAAGRLVASVGGRRVPVADAALELHGAELSLSTSTGPDGDFYVDNLVTGEYRLSARTATFACTAHLGFEQGKQPVVDVGELDCVVARSS